ncbi:MAG TPA: ATP-binding protein [Myxococcota bacterium]|nr:ATP-binding protein [Myxococcota bacterium]HRY96680.1 ATP-binding protein [Myxococcota bacterium]HSA20582.1 ATP-binding protein [Myxococcota bacterium]
MSAKRTLDPSTRRLRKLVLLVIATISIPSLLLSGFGLIAIQNERDAAFERIRELYYPVAYKLAGQVKERLRRLVQESGLALEQLERLGRRQAREPGAAFARLQAEHPLLTNFFVLDADGRPLLPAPDDPLPTWQGAPAGPLEEGLRLEFEAADPRAAAAHYQALLARQALEPAEAACLAQAALRSFGQGVPPSEECRRASGLGPQRCVWLNGLARSLDRAGAREEALPAWARVAEACAGVVVSGGYNLGLGALLRRLELLWAGQPAEALREAQALAARLSDPGLPASAGQRRFVAARLSGLLTGDSRPAVRPLAGLLAAQAHRAELLSGCAALGRTLAELPELRSVRIGPSLHMVLLRGGEVTVGAELVPELLEPELQATLEALEVEAAQAELVPSTQPLPNLDREVPAASVLISDGGFAWRLDLVLRGGETLDDLARTRTQLYRWALALLVLVLVAGISATLWLMVRENRLARLKTDFVSNVSHELRTPLTSIRMFTETLLLDRASDEAERKECLQIIAQESERLSRMVARILDFSRMEAGRRTYRLAPEPLGELVDAALAACRSELAARDFRVEVRVPAELPRVLADRDALVEVLINLISNAIKYSTERRELGLEARVADGQLELDVRDRGIGIPRHELGRIFEKFYRVETPLTSEVSGSGLGLSLVQYIVHGHGGEVRVESAVGEGSTFTVRLPLAPTGDRA